MKKRLNLLVEDISKMNFVIGFIILVMSSSCASPEQRTSQEFANIISVSAKGSDNSYTFSVGIKSPDTGCKQYADWWEVISEDGDLIYRRILAHSHVSEQPFVRSGGKVPINKSQKVFIRAHMNNSGYGGIVFGGSVDNGFEKTPIDSSFALNIEDAAPQPSDCAF